ncbi:MAG: hypothetical protein ACFFDN_39370 [Candidatus Hodarchaeota archaeon]
MKIKKHKRKELFYEGMKAIEVVTRIAQLNKHISILRFLTYRPTPNLSKKLSSKSNLSIMSDLDKLRELKLKGEFNYLGLALINYWLKKDVNFLVKQMVTHTKNFDNRRKFDISSQGSIIENLNSIISRLNLNKVLGFCSKVKLNDGSTCHIPMIDFSIEPSKRNLRIVKDALKQIGQEKGLILDSGRSYHFYGLVLIDEKNWRSFLGLCLLLSPFIDARYIAHRLIDGECVLRLSASKEKPKEPEVTDIL